MNSLPADNDVVLAVDLDGTLVNTDTLHEAVLTLARDSLSKLFLLPGWLSQGKAVLKAKLAEQALPDVTSLPYNTPLVDWLREQRAGGRRLALVTASNQLPAQAIADHLQLFDHVLASDRERNLAGDTKLELLKETFGAEGFDYVGNSQADVAVWAGARRAILVNTPSAVAVQAEQVAEVERRFAAPRVTMSDWRRVFRFHQWLKNLLLFVPLLAAHKIGDLAMLAELVLAVVSFCLCASAVYVTNDLLDLKNDREHPRKRYRPFAAGVLPIKLGVTLAPACLLVSLILASLVGADFVLTLLAYFALTTLYSLWLKRLVLVDCLVLTGLYTLRIIAGGVAVGLSLSFWLLTFSIFIFLSLAFVKRYAEIKMQEDQGNAGVQGRGYLVTDAPLVQMLGTAAGYMSILVLALYLQSEAVVQLYAAPELIWGAIPLILFWISWVWLQAHRGHMHDDPIVFAIKDRVSLVIAVLVAFCFGFASTSGSV